MPEVAAKEFLVRATLLKGVGYKPEREVRIVAIPGTAKAAKYAAKELIPNEFDAKAALPKYKTWTDPNTGKVRQYVALFDGSGLRLPISNALLSVLATNRTNARTAYHLS